MKSHESATILSDLLARLPGATLDGWRNPGQRGTVMKPFEFQLAISSPRALAILADVALNANVLLKVIIATEISGRWADPKRVRYVLSVPQEPLLTGQASPLEYVGSVLACRLRKRGSISQDEVDRLLVAWKTTIPTVDDLVLILDKKQPGDLVRHWALHGFEALIPGLVTAFAKVSNWEGRNSILFELIKYARKRPEVVEVALRGLADSAYMVRMQACAILAYSLRKDCIPMLEALLKHRDKKTQSDASAAIDAIKHKNHNYWLDREHTGSITWTLSAVDLE